MCDKTSDNRVCHAPSDRCLGCDHYYGKSAVCRYSPKQAELRADLMAAHAIALEVVAEATQQASKDFELLRIELAAANTAKAELSEALRHLVHNFKASKKRIDLGLALTAAESALKRNGCSPIQAQK
jgi:hypothetical protein